MFFPKHSIFQPNPTTVVSISPLLPNQSLFRAKPRMEPEEKYPFTANKKSRVDAYTPFVLTATKTVTTTTHTVTTTTTMTTTTTDLTVEMDTNMMVDEDVNIFEAQSFPKIAEKPSVSTRPPMSPSPSPSPTQVQTLTGEYTPVLTASGIMNQDFRYSKIKEVVGDGVVLPCKNYSELRNFLLKKFYRRALRKKEVLPSRGNPLFVNGVGSKNTIIAITQLAKIVSLRLRMKILLRNGKQVVVIA